LSLPASHGFAESLQDMLGESGPGLLESRIKIDATNLETLRRLVDEGLGYTVLPELAVRTLPAGDRHRALRFVAPTQGRGISLVAHRRFLKQDLIQAFEAVVLEVVPVEMTGQGQD
jgi:LysR family hydrogen peroxide-inducible transcriptional activator